MSYGKTYWYLFYRFAISQAGYRHIDCALIYGNEKEVGKAINDVIDEGIVTRDELFVTSKLWHTFHSRQRVLEGCRKSLSDLGLSYLDLFLIHAPFACREDEDLWTTEESDIDYLETWRGMEDCVELGLCKSIGLSNFNWDQTLRVLNECKVKPVTNQVECHPYFNQSQLIEMCAKYGIIVTAYSPFGSPCRPWAKKKDFSILDDQLLTQISERHNKSAAQVILRFNIDRKIVCVPKSATRTHILSNIEVFDFKLSEEEIKSISELDKNWRIFLFNPYSNHKYYPF
ncbi:aldose reductase-like protein [Leptotrombidium deliense]|uniref:Aldose reductase-like protein n=1 Tax=Leptotrombidium deliense TaxID=299467 RepID=A0A443S3X7_9ACAR|nr:aldose reductase-like protein [Leptotrombidium deliense]